MNYNLMIISDCEDSQNTFIIFKNGQFANGILQKIKFSANANEILPRCDMNFIPFSSDKTMNYEEYLKFIEEKTVTLKNKLEIKCGNTINETNILFNNNKLFVLNIDFEATINGKPKLKMEIIDENMNKKLITNIEDLI